MSLAWINSLPRLIVVVVTVLALGVVVGVAVQHGGESHSQAGPAPAPSLTPELLGKGEAATAAVNFVASWCALAGRTPKQWAADLKALSTPELAAQWLPNVSATLDGDCPWAAETVRYVAGPEGRVAVPTKSGETLAVDVRKVAGRVLVSNLEPERYPGDGSPGVTDY